MKKIFLLLALYAFALSAMYAQDDAKDKPVAYKYRIYLADKANSPYSINQPEAFLSKRAIERRSRYNIKIDQYDLPVSPAYLECLRNMGLKIHNFSKWQNTVVVETTSKDKITEVCKLPFVRGARLVWIDPQKQPKDASNRKDKIRNKRDTLESYYGHSAHQVQMLSLNKLHEQGYHGENMLIGVLDGGFYNADLITGVNQQDILGTRNFVNPGAEVFDTDSHGTMVLSCMAANVPYSMVGTAPEAQYYLIQTEDGLSEQLVEEDNYCAGVEYADSLGCDIVTASLGYYKFDHAEMSHKYKELDGLTAINSREASMAASRGILLLNSAGNEGDDYWKKIGFPADARNILAVGAVNSDSINTTFSSIGYSADHRIKPDAMAMGGNVSLLNTRGNASNADGTSFSCPIMAGAVACLWQAHRELTPTEIIDAVHKAGHYATEPNEVYGYGIPNLWKAHTDLSASK